MIENGNPHLKMTLEEWYNFWFDPHELMLNTSPIDGSDFHSPYPIGLAVFLTDALPKSPKAFCPLAQHSDEGFLANAIFSTDTTHKVGNQRLKAARSLKDKGFVFQHLENVHQRLSATETVSWYRKTPFTISPRGNGVDCHRNYEALIYKSIPIITDADESMRVKYQHLPVLFLESYAALTPGFLHKKLEEMMQTTYDFNYLARSYWEYRRPDIDIVTQSVYWLKRFNKFEHVRDYFLPRDATIIDHLDPEPYPDLPRSVFVPPGAWRMGLRKPRQRRGQ